VVALDAEFVSLGAQETEIREDGRLVIVNPAHFSLARVSVRFALARSRARALSLSLSLCLS
jgi:hypothetical protein